MDDANTETRRSRNCIELKNVQLYYQNNIQYTMGYLDATLALQVSKM